MGRRRQCFQRRRPEFGLARSQWLRDADMRRQCGFVDDVNRHGVPDYARLGQPAGLFCDHSASRSRSAGPARADPTTASSAAAITLRRRMGCAESVPAGLPNRIDPVGPQVVIGSGSVSMRHAVACGRTEPEILILRWPPGRVPIKISRRKPRELAVIWGLGMSFQSGSIRIRLVKAGRMHGHRDGSARERCAEVRVAPPCRLYGT